MAFDANDHKAQVFRFDLCSSSYRRRSVNPKGEFSVYFPLWGGGTDSSSDEKVSFLWEVATKQAPGNPQADWCFFFDQPREAGGRRAFPRTTPGPFPFQFLSEMEIHSRHSVPSASWARIR